MDDKEAILLAKKYVGEIYAEEGIKSLRLEEFEHILSAGQWIVTLSFARPWDTPRTRAQEVLENLGAASPIQRSSKVVTISDDGSFSRSRTARTRLRRNEWRYRHRLQRIGPSHRGRNVEVLRQRP